MKDLREQTLQNLENSRIVSLADTFKKLAAQALRESDSERLTQLRSAMQHAYESIEAIGR